MSKLISGCLVLSCALLFSSLAPAMQSPKSQAQEQIDREKPNANDRGSGVKVIPLAYEQVEQLRIQLLERGFDPGFPADRTAEIDPGLMEAISQFQAKYGLPATGQPDVATLDALTVPIEKNYPLTLREKRVSRR